MNKFSALLLSLFLSMSMYSQIHELGIFVGGSNYIGEIGPTTYVAPNKMAYGLLYKWNKSTRHSYRVSYSQSEITSNDIDSKEPSRNQRGYRFDNNIKELSLGLEFNFFEFNLHELDSQFTPYIYSGLNYTQYNGLFYVSGDTKYDSNHGTIAIPIAIGIKKTLNNRFVLGFEIGTRYTFADDIDGSNPTNDNLQNLKFGNINNNDWYVFSGFTLTYTFGQKPCYCAY
ncbi:hypothetical protein HNQ02_000219 [Flavobacterium sp. 7E]|uniref:type IX secretion system protein PorG n=1 Tax=Flavobacterium sp. 7E TaxID=2735898 RepID=UPI00156F10F5|nr:DUF6089 family protein [Flavobacterium sp. 7E]NRS87319.1 hypothetical protein [Flavobacterium sp. 7E]